MFLRGWLALSLLIVCAFITSAQPQPAREGVVIFKDGFYVKGRITQPNDFIIDPIGGASVVIPSAKGFLHVDDRVRRIVFDPSFTQDVLETKPGDIAELMVLKRTTAPVSRDMILPTWEVSKIPDWDEKWERVVQFTSPRGNIDCLQRIVLMTPTTVIIHSMRYKWDKAYLTMEMGEELVRKLVLDFFKEKKDMKEHERLLKVATFLQQVGFHDGAKKELDAILLKFPDQEKAARPMLDQIKELKANQFVENIERASKVSQHLEAQELLLGYEKEMLGEAASMKNKILARELKAKYAASNASMDSAIRCLKEFALIVKDNKAFWNQATKAVIDELNLDTLPRLELFNNFAEQHERERKEKSKLTQTTEEVLSLAVTAWVLDGQGPEPDFKAARRLFNARQMMLEYLKSDNPGQRTRILADYNKERTNELPIDVLARVLRTLPPPTPHDTLNTEQQKLTIDLPDADNGSYLVQLPPDYHHTRPFPVLVVLHSGRDKADETLKRWQEQATKHGFILIAPLWGGKAVRSTYNFGHREHTLVLDAIRDAKRRFNLDSDRVFLFGWEDGATMAFDVGLSHPDLFAGVMPMNGKLSPMQQQRYWCNAQYLPFYAIEGDKNGKNPVAVRKLYIDWIRSHYPSLYVEYKGRISEWYSQELPELANWMSRKKRHLPVKEMGRHNNSSVGQGEEFRTLRATDNRFYWLSTDSINDLHLAADVRTLTTTKPATMQASIAVGNVADLKAGARIWSQVNIRTFGLKQVTLRLSPGMVDFTKQVAIRLNGNPVVGQRMVTPSVAVMLEELYATGDRQRLVFAKFDLRP